MHLLFAETAWRLLKKQRQRGFSKRIVAAPSSLKFRPLRYFDLQRDPLQGGVFRATLDYADAICRGEFNFLGYPCAKLGRYPDWHTDFISGASWPREPQVAVVRHDGSDVKVPWDLSRLQFLPVLGKAHVLTGEEKYRARIWELVDHWITENPTGIGVNWAIAMEAALRALSLCFTLDLLTPFRPEEAKMVERITCSLWEHLLFIEAHSEFSFFIRSNHYLSNIVGLLALSAYLEGPGMDARRDKYAGRLQREIFFQTYADGADFEASMGYHLLVCQMFTAGYRIIERAGLSLDHRFRERLEHMHRFAWEMADVQGRLPHVGDCDDGRVELLVDDLEQMRLPLEQRNSLQVAGFLGVGERLFGYGQQFRNEDAEWYGIVAPVDKRGIRPRVTLAPDCGVARVSSDPAEVWFLTMPNGIKGRGSHTHADKLSVLLQLNGDPVFVDSGTACYTRDAALRNTFRATAAHNTIRVDDAEQNSIDRALLFRAGNEARVSAIEIRNEEGTTVLRANHSGYERIGVSHERTLRINAESVEIRDDLAGTGEHRIDLFFHLGSGWDASAIESQGAEVGFLLTKDSREVRLWSRCPSAANAAAEPVLHSQTYGFFFSAQCLHLQIQASLPLQIQTRITWK
ncbi:MAG: hypothetical protein JWN45_3238 [Acidobacteriaceae bacterium]|nr:hypothetical protein [Acidobacteriaceae bacterium]